MKRVKWSIGSLFLLILLAGCTKIGFFEEGPSSGGNEEAVESWQRVTFIRVVNKIPNTIVKVEFTSDKELVSSRRTWGANNKWGDIAADGDMMTVAPHEVGLYMPYNVQMRGSSVNPWHQDMVFSVFDPSGKTCLENHTTRFRSSSEARPGEASFESKFGGEYKYEFTFRSWVDNYLISDASNSGAGGTTTSRWCCFGELIISPKKK